MTHVKLIRHSVHRAEVLSVYVDAALTAHGGFTTGVFGYYPITEETSRSTAFDTKRYINGLPFFCYQHLRHFRLLSSNGSKRLYDLSSFWASAIALALFRSPSNLIRRYKAFSTANLKLSNLVCNVIMIPPL